MATNTIGVYDTTCYNCEEEIWIIPADDGIHVTWPDYCHDEILSLQQTARRTPIKDMAWQLYAAAFEACGTWMKANPTAPIGDKESIRLAKQVEATRNAWLACGGTEQVVIGTSELDSETA